MKPVHDVPRLPFLHCKLANFRASYHCPAHAQQTALHGVLCLCKLSPSGAGLLLMSAVLVL